MKLSHLGAVAVAAVLAAGSAQAALVTVKYSGVVASGLDTTGEFGAPGASLAGATFTAGYVFYDQQPGSSSVYNPPLGSTFESSLFPSGSTSPRAWIRINSRRLEMPCELGWIWCRVTLDLSSGRNGVWGVSSDLWAFDVDSQRPEVWEDRLTLGLTSLINPFVTHFDYHTPMTHAFMPGDISTGHLLYSDEDHIATDDRVFHHLVRAELTPLSVSIGLPEPDVWALLLLGFGGAGVMLRRARRRAAATPA